MNESRGISAHGTALYRNNAFIEDLGELTPPALNRSMISDFRHNRRDEDVVPGRPKYGLCTFGIGFVSANQFLTAWITKSIDEYVLGFTDGAVWGFDGRVVNVQDRANVDDLLVATVTVKVQGVIDFNAMIPGEVDDALLAEDGNAIELEQGGTLLLES